MAIERHSLKSTVIDEIKKYMIEQQLSAGDKLPTERKFTEIFDVSRSVVREALSYLENTGVICVRQGQGAFINESNIGHLVSNFFLLWQINGGDIRDIQNLRLLFESAAMDEIVRQQQPESLDALKERVEDSRRAETMETFRETDRAFHQQILQATGNSLFEQMTQVITTYFFEAAAIEMETSDMQRAVREHEEMVAALQNGDAGLAKDLLRTHMIHTKM